MFLLYLTMPFFPSPMHSRLSFALAAIRSAEDLAQHHLFASSLGEM